MTLLYDGAVTGPLICTCGAGARPAETHDATCHGAAPTGWRARVPEFLWPEVTRIYSCSPRSEAPIYRAIALRYLRTARYGPETP